MIFYSKNQSEISMLPIELVEVIEYNLDILETEYQINKDNYLDTGGFVLVVDSYCDLDILERFNVNFEDCVPEYVEQIKGMKDEWISLLLLLGDDYGIIILMKNEMATENILSFIE